MRPYFGVECFVFRALNKAWREAQLSFYNAQGKLADTISHLQYKAINEHDSDISNALTTYGSIESQKEMS
jgi:hypothetical protein